MTDGTKLSRQSDAIATRLADIKGLTGAAKASASEFKAADRTFQQLTKAAEAAEEKRDAAVNAVIDADAARDTAVLALADALVGAGLGKRSNPFASYSKYTPANLVKLGHLAESREVRALSKKILAAKPPSNVASLAKDAVKKSDAVDELVQASGAPKTAYTKAFAARDAHLPIWQKAMASLRVQMKAALASDAGAYKALFARPEGAVAKRAPKAKPAATNGAAAPEAKPAEA